MKLLYQALVIGIIPLLLAQDPPKVSIQEFERILDQLLCESILEKRNAQLALDNLGPHIRPFLKQYYLTTRNPRLKARLEEFWQKYRWITIPDAQHQIRELLYQLRSGSTGEDLWRFLFQQSPTGTLELLAELGGDPMYATRISLGYFICLESLDPYFVGTYLRTQLSYQQRQNFFAPLTSQNRRQFFEEGIIFEPLKQAIMFYSAGEFTQAFLTSAMGWTPNLTFSPPQWNPYRDQNPLETLATLILREAPNPKTIIGSLGQLYSYVNSSQQKVRLFTFAVSVFTRNHRADLIKTLLNLPQLTTVDLWDPSIWNIQYAWIIYGAFSFLQLYEELTPFFTTWAKSTDFILQYYLPIWYPAHRSSIDLTNITSITRGQDLHSLLIVNKTTLLDIARYMPPYEMTFWDQVYPCIREDPILSGTLTQQLFSLYARQQILTGSIDNLLANIEEFYTVLSSTLTSQQLHAWQWVTRLQQNLQAYRSSLSEEYGDLSHRIQRLLYKSPGVDREIILPLLFTIIQKFPSFPTGYYLWLKTLPKFSASKKDFYTQEILHLFATHRPDPLYFFSHHFIILALLTENPDTIQHYLELYNFYHPSQLPLPVALYYQFSRAIYAGNLIESESYLQQIFPHIEKDPQRLFHLCLLDANVSRAIQLLEKLIMSPHGMNPYLRICLHLLHQRTGIDNSFSAQMYLHRHLIKSNTWIYTLFQFILNEKTLNELIQEVECYPDETERITYLCQLWFYQGYRCWLNGQYTEAYHAFQQVMQFPNLISYEYLLARYFLLRLPSLLKSITSHHTP